MIDVSQKEKHLDKVYFLLQLYTVCFLCCITYQHLQEKNISVILSISSVELVILNINLKKYMKLNFKNEGELVRYCEEYMQKKNEYNGWSNYATWRIKIELVDDASYENDECGQEFEDVQELASYIQENIELLLGDEVGGYCEGLNNDYALDFVSEVNWYEIAKNISEDNDKIIISNK